MPGGAVKSISLGRNGRHFVVLSADRTVRLYLLSRVLEGTSPPLRELQDAHGLTLTLTLTLALTLAVTLTLTLTLTSPSP